jgi:hypothetical protein
VNQGGGLERLSGRFLGQLAGSELAELIVNQGKELTGTLSLAGGDSFRICVTSLMSRK